jgi:hypothetical protein
VGEGDKKERDKEERRGVWEAAVGEVLVMGGIST